MKVLRRVLNILGIVAILLGGPIPAAFAQEDERILEFTIDVSIESDGDIRFVETILYDFGVQDRHGIFREIPVRDKLDSGKFWVHPISISSVSRDGVDEMYSESQNGLWASLRIGDPDIFLTGVHKYSIEYKVSGGLFPLTKDDVQNFPNLSKGDISFYWDVIGNSWQVPIEEAQVNITFPTADDSLVLAENCIVGTPTNQIQCRSMVSQHSWATSEVIQPGEAMTISIQMNPGMFDVEIVQQVDEGPIEVFSARWQSIVKEKLIIGTLIAIAILTSILLLWRKKMNSIKSSKVDGVVRFEPPPQKVAELSAAWKGIVDARALTATLLDLAARGKIEVHVDKSDNLKIKKLDTPIKVEIFEQKILDVLFRISNQTTISGYDSELDEVVRDISSTLLKSAEKSGIRNRAGSRSRTPFIIGMILSAFFFFLSLMTLAFPEIFGLVVPSALALLIGFIFTAIKTPRTETPKSAEFLSHLLGFKKAMDTDSGALRRKFAQKSGLSAGNIFATFLPLAVIFELEDSWLANFPDLSLDEIQSSGIYVVSIGSLQNSINNSHEAFAAAMTPPSSSGSGSGGGSSGGGGGGGGGGSW